MPALVIVLRVLAFAGPMLLLVTGRRVRFRTRSRRSGSERAPLVANFAAFSLYVPSLLLFSRGSVGQTALLLALLGSLLALGGAGLVIRSRAVLGAAWSLVPSVDLDTGLVTTGPYRLVRHPIYLGLALLALGQALAFVSLPALMIVVFGIVPTFAWRAYAEEVLLSRIFGECHEAYRERTRMIIPYVL